MPINFSLSQAKRPSLWLALLGVMAMLLWAISSANAQANGPTLTIQDQISADPSSQVAVPVTFTSNGESINAITFSVDMDESLLSFDDTDSDGDNIPDAVALSLPNGYIGSVSFDANDTDGEIDIAIFTLSSPALSDGQIGTITLQTGSNQGEAAVAFSSDPAASFGNTSGQSVTGTTDNGSVLIGDGGNTPVTDFTCTPTSGEAPLVVNCTDNSTGDITNWSWNFGDGTTSTEQNPSHTYNADGTYTVSLTVTRADGDDTETKTDYISVPGTSAAALSCEDVTVFPNGTISVLLTAQGTNVYGIQSTVSVSDPALVDLLETRLDGSNDAFFTQPIAIASNQKDPTTDSWLGGASQQNPNGPVSGEGRFATLLYGAADTTGEVTLTITPRFSDRDGKTIPSQPSTCTLTIQPFGDIAGNVTHQGRDNHANIEVTAAGPAANSVSTNTSGAFTINDLPDANTYQVTADAQSYLPVCTTATVAVVSGQTTTLPDAQLPGGDLNDDLIINIGDATRLTANFNNPASNDPSADINTDGTINIGDWAILQGNYDLAGCQPWPN